VDFLTNVIKRGEWKMNGDSIKFDKSGVLIDGQHRLFAVVFSQVAVSMLVVRGLEREAQETIDIGAKRSLGDALKLRGEKNSTCLAAIIAYHWRMETGNVRVVGVRPTIAQAIAHLEANPALRDAMDNTQGLRKRFRLSPAMTAAVWYELSSINAEDAQDFLDRLNTGTGLEENSPIHRLRSWMERQLTSGVGSRASVVITHAMIYKAWNYYRKGQEVEHLTWRPTGRNAEPFPEAI